MVCWLEAALPDAAKTLAAAEVARTLRRVGDEESFDMASLLGASFLGDGCPKRAGCRRPLTADQTFDDALLQLLFWKELSIALLAGPLLPRLALNENCPLD